MAGSSKPSKQSKQKRVKHDYGIIETTIYSSPFCNVLHCVGLLSILCHYINSSTRSMEVCSGSFGGNTVITSIKFVTNLHKTYGPWGHSGKDVAPFTVPGRAARQWHHRRLLRACWGLPRRHWRLRAGPAACDRASLIDENQQLHAWSTSLIADSSCCHFLPTLAPLYFSWLQKWSVSCVCIASIVNYFRHK